MTPAIPIPRADHQRLLNATNNVSRAAASLNGSATFQSIVAAEQAIGRAIGDLRDMKGRMRQLKQQARQVERDRAQDRAIIERSHLAAGVSA
jgi:hypothetical protein